MVLVDWDGAWPKWMEKVGGAIKDGWDGLCDGVSYVWNNYIYGEDTKIHLSHLFLLLLLYL